MTEETLMTTAATTPEGDASQPTEPAATAAVQDGQQQPPEAKGPEATPETPQGAPEKYADFVAPEGTAIDAGLIGEFSEVAKELNLPQASAQKVIDKMVPVMAKRQAQQLAEASSQWAEQSKTDKEFGGASLDENLGMAKKALDTFASPDLRKLLNESGLGNHPEIIRTFYKVGKAISEDKFVTGGTGSRPGEDPAKRLFPNQA